MLKFEYLSKKDGNLQFGFFFSLGVLILIAKSPLIFTFYTSRSRDNTIPSTMALRSIILFIWISEGFHNFTTMLPLQGLIKHPTPNILRFPLDTLSKLSLSQPCLGGCYLHYSLSFLLNFLPFPKNMENMKLYHFFFSFIIPTSVIYLFIPLII